MVQGVDLEALAGAEAGLVAHSHVGGDLVLGGGEAEGGPLGRGVAGHLHPPAAVGQPAGHHHHGAPRLRVRVAEQRHAVRPCRRRNLGRVARCRVLVGLPLPGCLRRRVVRVCHAARGAAGGLALAGDLPCQRRGGPEARPLCPQRVHRDAVCRHARHGLQPHAPLQQVHGRLLLGVKVPQPRRLGLRLNLRAQRLPALDQDIHLGAA